FTGWFAEQVFSEPHSTKGIDDIVDWSGGTTPETLIRTVVEGLTPRMREMWQRLTCPVLIIHGSDDRVAPLANSHTLQAALPHAVVDRDRRRWPRAAPARPREGEPDPAFLPRARGPWRGEAGGGRSTGGGRCRRLIDR